MKKKIRLAPIEDCYDDCPYFSMLTRGKNIACGLQSIEPLVDKKISYDDRSLDDALEEMMSQCPLLTLDDILLTPNKIIYEKYKNLLE